MSKQLSAIFAFIFVISLLFFAISKEITRDIKNTQTNTILLQPPTLPAAVATTTQLKIPDVVPAEIPNLTTSSTEQNLSLYVQVTDGCSEHFEGECLRVRSGAGTEFPVVAKLRNGMVLKVAETITVSDTTWYKIIFDEWLRYPDRVTSNWYVAAQYVTPIYDIGDLTTDKISAFISDKEIIVDRSDQKLYAYDDNELIMTATTSTGLDLTPTPRGIFSIYKKTPSRYMQGPLPNLSSDQYYDLPGVPWNLYFTEGGAVIHGAYWHDKFGTKYSHGCVNLSPEDAYKLYTWSELGTKVTVRD